MPPGVPGPDISIDKKFIIHRGEHEALGKRAWLARAGSRASLIVEEPNYLPPDAFTSIHWLKGDGALAGQARAPRVMRVKGRARLYFSRTARNKRL